MLGRGKPLYVDIDCDMLCKFDELMQCAQAGDVVNANFSRSVVAHRDDGAEEFRPCAAARLAEQSC